MVAQVTGLQPGDFVHTLGDAHLYLEPPRAGARAAVARTPRPLPTMRHQSGGEGPLRVSASRTSARRLRRRTRTSRPRWRCEACPAIRAAQPRDAAIVFALRPGTRRVREPRSTRSTRPEDDRRSAVCAEAARVLRHCGMGRRAGGLRGLVSTTSPHFAAGTASTSRTYSCGRPSAGAASARRC